MTQEKFWTEFTGREGESHREETENKERGKERDLRVVLTSVPLSRVKPDLKGSESERGRERERERGMILFFWNFAETRRWDEVEKEVIMVRFMNNQKVSFIPSIDAEIWKFESKRDDERERERHEWERNRKGWVRKRKAWVREEYEGMRWRELMMIKRCEFNPRENFLSNAAGKNVFCRSSFFQD